MQVASSAQNLRSGADVWDSGKIKSSQTLGVRYAGQPLQSGARYFWRVQVWDEKNRALPASAPSFWQMGLLRQSDWRAQWISAQTPRDVKVDGLDVAARADVALDVFAGQTRRARDDVGYGARTLRDAGPA